MQAHMVEFAVSRSRSRTTAQHHRSSAPEQAPTADRAIPSPTPASGVTWANRYRSKLRFSDGVIITAAVAATFLVRFDVVGGSAISGEVALRYTGLAVAVLAVWAASLSAFRSRDLRVIGVGASEYKRVLHASSSTFGLLAICFLVFGADTARWFFTVALPAGLGSLLVSRWLWRQWLNTQRTHGHYLARVIVVGKRVDVAKVVAQIRASSGAAYSVVGAVVEGATTRPLPSILEDLVLLDGLERVAEFADTLGVEGVVVAGQPDDAEFVHDLAWQLEGGCAELILATSLVNVAGPRIHYRPVDGLPLLHVEIPQFDGAKHLAKRAMDVTLAGLALLVLSPVFAVIAALIRMDSAGPAFFSQERVGRDGVPFRIHKFRSMRAGAPDQLAALAIHSQGNGVLFKLRDDPRVTRLGRTLRKYSLDELPQLWNVLMGHMSLVGPRPPLPTEVSAYEDHVHRRLYIKPGLTGMWQVNGRSNLSWEDSVRLDLYYVENWSLMGDLIILWRTVKVVAQPVGAY
jgi:exopolysaccharide biosynthesis polyprenyl glycosylphosphotransferase